MEKTERWEKLEEESHEACLPRVLSKSYSWGQKDEQRSTDFIDYRGRKRLPGRLAGCITKESKDQSQAKWVSVSRDGGSWSKNLVMSEPEMLKARQMRQLNSQLRSPTVLGYKEDKPCCGHSPGGTIPPMHSLCAQVTYSRIEEHWATRRRQSAKSRERQKKTFKKQIHGPPWWSSGSQCRRPRFYSWSRN